MARRAGLATLAVLALVALLSGAALASGTSVTTTGAKASWYSSPNYMYVYDTLADGMAVYAEYCWGSGPCGSGTRLYNRQGSGTVKRFVLAPTNPKITFRVCGDVPLYPNNCSSWVTTDA